LCRGLPRPLPRPQSTGGLASSEVSPLARLPVLPEVLSHEQRPIIADRQLSEMIKMIAHFRSRLAVFDKIRYIGWRLVPLTSQITVRLETGERISIRRPPEPDLYTAHEVFAAEIYSSPRPLPPDSVGRIIDVGANVGCTVIHWCRNYPRARIDAVEPHPESRSRLVYNVKINGFDDRVTVHPFAAGSSNGDGFLTDDGLKSALIVDTGIGGIPIKIVDFFGLVGDEPVDILKIDCEGGEYPILMDPRFEGFRARALVMEWHNTQKRPRAGKEIMERLVALGWGLERSGDDLAQRDTGMVWDYR
jgi:FkbM family methyltransferase